MQKAYFIFALVMHVRIIVLCVFLNMVHLGYSQITIPMPQVPKMRELSHIQIDKAQANLIKFTGNDSLFIATENEAIDWQITQILQIDINNLQAEIELDSSITEAQKFIWLRSIEAYLKDFLFLLRNQKIKPLLLGDAVKAYKSSYDLHKNGLSILPVVDANTVEVGKLLYQNEAFKQNSGLQDCLGNLVLKEAVAHPNNIINMLLTNSQLPNQDTLITLAAFNNPQELYNYASSKFEIAQKIRDNQHPLVKTIASLSKMNDGRLYFPFVEKLYKGLLSFQQVKEALQTPDAYYDLLVKTQIDFAKELNEGKKPLLADVLYDKLKEKTVEFYVDEINALHDVPQEAIRFKRIEKLQPQHLYYICILAEEDIYTSSYLGVYKKLFEKLKSGRSDSLLMLVNHDHFKKFIKMAATYNVLNDFLKRMPITYADNVMKRFVGDLASQQSFEDAVDVANSFAGLNDKLLQKKMVADIKENLQQALIQNNAKAKKVYRILSIIFASLDSTQNVDVSQQLGIHPIFTLPIKKLVDTSTKRIVIQQFFYGDKDGRNVYGSFINAFRNKNWRIVDKKEWTEVIAVNPKVNMHIFSNKPLDENKDLDAQAQRNLTSYLDSLEWYPSVVLHRGHSYYLNSTIEQLSPSAKLVLLGSCGSYQSLNKVLKLCPNAHIISSKQVGTGLINQSIITALTQLMREGKDINWPTLWLVLGKQLNKVAKEHFEDYVPPHKNLGAIFIKAYNNYKD